MSSDKDVIFFEQLRREDVALVGGKNSSLGEMVQELGAMGIRVPPGFATTSDAFRRFIIANDLEARIAETLKDFDSGKITLHQAGETIRAAIVSGDWPSEIEDSIRSAYRELSKRAGTEDVSVAVRSSATAEDLPDASFAGQQETYLNIVG